MANSPTMAIALEEFSGKRDDIYTSKIRMTRTILGQ